MEFLYIFFLLVVPALNFYLSVFNEAGLLPYRFGYLSFANLTHLTIAIMSVWYLGWVWGIFIFLLYFFGIIDSSLMWWIRYLYMKKNPSLSTTAYSLFSVLTIGQIIFTVVSLFVADFEQLRDTVEWHIWREGYLYIVIIVIVMVVGYLIHFILLRSVKKVRNE